MLLDPAHLARPQLVDRAEIDEADGQRAAGAVGWLSVSQARSHVNRPSPTPLLSRETPVRFTPRSTAAAAAGGSDTMRG